jgi:site-specific DNA-methyltransferase (adenine-specific)
MEMKQQMLVIEDGHHVIEGDAWQVLRGLGDESAAGLITDPPYCSGGASAGARQSDASKKYPNRSGCRSFSGDQRDQRSFYAWATLWLAEAHRVLEPGAPVCVFIDWRQLPVLTDAVQAAGFVWRGVAVWDKTANSRPQKGRPRHQAEYVVWGSKGDWTSWPGAPTLDGVVRAQSPRQRQHIAQKPVDVLRHFSKLVRPGGLILDPFCGSGTGGVAAALEGRSYLGVEIDPVWAEAARERIRLEGQLATD